MFSLKNDFRCPYLFFSFLFISFYLLFIFFIFVYRFSLNLQEKPMNQLIFIRFYPVNVSGRPFPYLQSQFCFRFISLRTKLGHLKILDHLPSGFLCVAHARERIQVKSISVSDDGGHDVIDNFEFPCNSMGNLISI